MEKFTEIEITRKVKVSDQDIDDIMACALEGGITYWCCKCEVYGGKYLGEYASDQISRGGTLIFFDAESDDQWSMNKGDFINGLKQYLSESPDAGDILNPDGTLDLCDADADVADCVVQYALFKEIVFG